MSLFRGARLNSLQGKEVPDSDQYPAEEDNPDAEGDPEPQHHGDVGGAVADGDDPETPLPGSVAVLADIFQAGEREVENGQVEEPIGSEEGKMTVGNGDLAAVGIIVDRRQGVHESPETRTDQVIDGEPNDVGPDERIDDRILPFPHMHPG